jgi:hypothetical protein
LVEDACKDRGQTLNCDFPNHRDKDKWHTHKAADCCTCKNWQDNKEGAANNADVETEDDDAPPQDEDKDTKEPGSALTAMLANALSLAAANSVTSELIANAMDAIHQS